MSREPGHSPRSALRVPDVRDCHVQIYALRDPLTREIRYVGKSKTPESRLAAHRGREASYHLRVWVLGLRRVGERPELVLLETIEPGCDAAEAERRWLRCLLTAGAPLLNVDGGVVGQAREGTMTRVTFERLRSTHAA